MNESHCELRWARGRVQLGTDFNKVINGDTLMPAFNSGYRFKYSRVKLLIYSLSWNSCSPRLTMLAFSHLLSQSVPMPPSGLVY